MPHPTYKSSIYPLRPRGSEVVVRVSGQDFSYNDGLNVLLMSSVVVGGALWVPALYAWAWRRFARIPKHEKRRRALYAAFLLSVAAFYYAGPHRTHRFGKRIKVHSWDMWKSCQRFFAFEVVADQGYESVKSVLDEQAIVAIAPHGLFPFSLAFSAISQTAAKSFGKFRAVAATATDYVPCLRDVLRWLNTVDASKKNVDRALAEGSRLGIAPGGIAEMFEGYPKKGTHPDDEYTVVGRGIFRMAVKHGVPVVPVYCFGSTKLLRRLQLPSIVEKISLMLRTSLVLMYGQLGLPIPFRQKLLYVMGKPIYPPTPRIGNGSSNAATSVFDQQVEEMFVKYCAEMVRIFDRHKESYGWSHKNLKTKQRHL